MGPLAGFIDANTIAHDANARAFSVLAPGVTPNHFGQLRLTTSLEAREI